MRVYRICRLAHRVLDGEGARLYGGRWNEPGRAVVYTSATLALAALELLVHVDPDDVPGDLVALSIELPDDAGIEDVDVTALPPTWATAAESPECRAVGEAWLRAGRALALRVPSAPVPEESNVLLDPRHPRMRDVRVVAERRFAFDARLVRR